MLIALTFLLELYLEDKGIPKLSDLVLWKVDVKHKTLLVNEHFEMINEYNLIPVQHAPTSYYCVIVKSYFIQKSYVFFTE